MRATILCCLFLGLAAVALADDKLDVMAISKACLPEAKVSEKEVDDFWGPNPNFDSATPNMKCHVKCVMEKMGHLKGGVFDAEKASKNWKELPELKEIKLANPNAFNTCKTEKGENDCETAFKITKCIRTSKA